VSERLTIVVTVGTSTEEHSLRSQVGMGSESDCLLGQFERTLRISDSEAGLKSGGVIEGHGECGDEVVWPVTYRLQTTECRPNWNSHSHAL